MKIRKSNEAIRQPSSANKAASHIPFNPQKTGSKKINKTCRAKVRKKEMVADTPPSFKAVKKADEKIFSPDTR